MIRASSGVRFARLAAAAAAVSVATVVMMAEPAHAFAAPPLLPPLPGTTGGPCGATFDDGGLITGVVHTYVEPLVLQPGRDSVHQASCSVSYALGL